MLEIPQPYWSIILNNFETLEERPLSNESLANYFDGCFNDVYREIGLYKMWVCVKCLAVGRCTYGVGDKPKKCHDCGNKVYQISTFQAMSSHYGKVFDYGCQYLLNEKYSIPTNPASDSTRLYNFEIRNDIVVGARGSPKYVINPEGTRSVSVRAGMRRTDTVKKVFANAETWHGQFPNGSFYVLTNAIQNRLREHGNETITAILDFTKKDQVESFVGEVRALIDG